jgi:hypothetical protein
MGAILSGTKEKDADIGNMLKELQFADMFDEKVFNSVSADSSRPHAENESEDTSRIKALSSIFVSDEASSQLVYHYPVSQLSAFVYIW